MTDFDKVLKRWYVGELGGERFFAALADSTPDARHADGWRLLATLERTTGERVRAACEAAAIPLPDAAASRTDLLDYVDAMRDKPWRDNMHTLAGQIATFVATIRESADRAPAPFAAIAADYLAHEQALLDFARAEAEGADGAAHVHALLDRWSAGDPR